MWVQLHKDAESGRYEVALLKIGEDHIARDAKDMITLNSKFCNIVQSRDELLSNVYPHVQNST